MSMSTNCSQYPCQYTFSEIGTYNAMDQSTLDVSCIQINHTKNVVIDDSDDSGLGRNSGRSSPEADDLKSTRSSDGCSPTSVLNDSDSNSAGDLHGCSELSDTKNGRINCVIKRETYANHTEMSRPNPVDEHNQILDCSQESSTTDDSDNESTNSLGSDDDSHMSLKDVDKEDASSSDGSCMEIPGLFGENNDVTGGLLYSAGSAEASDFPANTWYPQEVTWCSQEVSTPHFRCRNGFDSESDDDEDDFTYLKAYCLATGHGYAVPRRDPRTIKEAVNFWERDFEVNNAIYRRMCLWNDLGLVPDAGNDTEGHQRYEMIKTLNEKWRECGRNFENWFNKYGGRGMSQIVGSSIKQTLKKKRKCVMNFKSDAEEKENLERICEKDDNYHIDITCESDDGIMTYPPRPKKTGEIMTYPPRPNKTEEIMTYPPRSNKTFRCRKGTLKQNCWDQSENTIPRNDFNMKITDNELENGYGGMMSLMETQVEGPVQTTAFSTSKTNDEAGKLDDIFCFIDSIIENTNDTELTKLGQKRRNIARAGDNQVETKPLTSPLGDSQPQTDETTDFPQRNDRENGVIGNDILPHMNITPEQSLTNDEIATSDQCKLSSDRGAILSKSQKRRRRRKTQKAVKCEQCSSKNMDSDDGPDLAAFWYD